MIVFILRLFTAHHCIHPQLVVPLIEGYFIQCAIIAVLGFRYRYQPVTSPGSAKPLQLQCIRNAGLEYNQLEGGILVLACTSQIVKVTWELNPATYPKL